MNSQSALSNLIFPAKENFAHNNLLVLKKIRFYNCAIIYLRDAQLLIKTKDGQSFNVPPESLCYVEKNTVIDITLKVLGKGVPYELYQVDSDVLSCICKVMEPLLLDPQNVNQMRRKIFTCPVDETDTKIFKRLTGSDVPQHRQLYKITYLLSKMRDIESLVYSLSVSTDTTFTERLKSIIEADLSKSWKLADLASILHMSEVSIRKKLEKESNNFNTLVLDIRMHQAAKLITTTEKHINRIANEVGYTSTSYFIRNFKEFFGITPKQFALKVKK
ncbi:AraC family transcriptional regulator [Citrobacter sp. Cb022]|uniref:AraC family transcriptional regulator n=1 Tax=Citrobacter sp. Cb022 TaxID=2985019 RepID=UPI00257C2C90|nr:AraC family transcriptional regulator [Citrobacter sp. Cb022]MDM3409260.1 AraC family transcriptional regulator [Citrobacter sp. Cb022]